jgi:hypothetical protein
MSTLDPKSQLAASQHAGEERFRSFFVPLMRLAALGSRARSSSRRPVKVEGARHLIRCIAVASPGAELPGENHTPQSE